MKEHSFVSIEMKQTYICYETYILQHVLMINNVEVWLARCHHDCKETQQNSWEFNKLALISASQLCTSIEVYQ